MYANLEASSLTHCCLARVQVQTVGSGYIALPPQKRFESPVIMQPPTVAVRINSVLRLLSGSVHSTHTWSALCSTWITLMNIKST